MSEVQTENDQPNSGADSSENNKDQETSISTEKFSMDELIEEVKSPFLRKYWNKDGFLQNLISRQEEIDSVLINYVQGKWERKKIVNNPVPKRERVREMKKKKVDIIKLSKLRNWIHLVPKTEPKPKPTPTTIFKDILQQSKQMVSEWDGEMYFVYLPSYYSQTSPVQGNHYSLSERRNREIVMQTTTELDIPIIDIQNEVFKTHPDPLSLFPLRMMHNHYNAEGYRLVAEAIGKQLDADHYISIN